MMVVFFYYFINEKDFEVDKLWKMDEKMFEVRCI